MNIIIDEKTIKRKVFELAKRIENDYRGEELTIICVLKGAFIFCNDLLKNITLENIKIDFVKLSSYQGIKTTGNIMFKLDTNCPIMEKNLLIVEDIVDTGLTMQFLTKELSNRCPKSLKVCTLLDKPSKRKVDFTPDYIGFEIEDMFVIGYGLDLDDKYRLLPNICEIE